MAKRIHRVTTVITGISETGSGIRVFTLAAPDGWQLPPFTAGSHIDLHLPSGTIRQYSLCNDPNQGDVYRVAVREEGAGRGGSAEMHQLDVGEELLASLPRNTFPLVDAPRYVLIAGGIGITPFLSMLPVLERTAADYVLHVCAPTAKETPFMSDLVSRADSNRIQLHHSRENTRITISKVIASLGPKDHLYGCGPARMIEEIVDSGGHLGDRLHVERFGFDGPVPDAAYEIELARSGKIIPVEPGQTMLNALRGANVEVGSSCEGGVCLDCKTRYFSGSPVHRDLVMRASERGEYITPCVSGCAGNKIVLDL